MNYRMLGAVLVIALQVTVAQVAEESDSVRTFRFPEIIVTATRTAISPKDSPSPVEVVSAHDFQNLNAFTIADVLRSSQGVFLQDYGANGALKTASFRGTSSQHLLVLLNGNRLNNFQNNLVDFSLFPIQGIGRVEILRGGSSALYGAEALGGVVNILTEEAIKPGIRAEGSVGSYGYRRYLVEGRTRMGALSLLGGIGQEQGRDDYPFAIQIPGSGTMNGKRGNANFLKRHLFVHAGADYDEQLGSTVAVHLLKSGRGVPGSVSFPTPLAWQDDETANITADVRDSHISGTEVALKASFIRGTQRYVDPDPAFPIESRYNNNSFSLNPQVQTVLLGENRLLVGAEFVQGKLESQDFGGAVQRVQKSFYVSDETVVKVDRDFADRLMVFGTLRYDGISDVGESFSPKVGFNFRLSRASDVRIRGSYGRNFHAPSFNDLYYPGFGNPQLKPERSTSFDVGLLAEMNAFGVAQMFEFTYFRLDTKDRILFDLTLFIPRNIGFSTSSGIEFRYEASLLKGLLEFGGSYSLVQAVNKTTPGDPAYGKQLLFIPKQNASLRLSARFGLWKANITHNVVGKRYITEDNGSFLDPFGITNVNLAGRLPVGIVTSHAKLEVSNLWNKDYQVFPSYPMPRRTYRATVGVEL